MPTIIGPALPNIPWEDKPKGCKDVLWRYSRNPIVPRDLLPTSNSISRAGLCILALITICMALGAPASARDIERTVPGMWLDPITRCFHVAYQVPTSAPDEVAVLCSWSPAGEGNWHPAKVTPLVSETALREIGPVSGRLTERRAAGLERTVIFNPYPEAQPQGRVDADFRVEIQTTDGKPLATEQIRLKADNSDVIYIEDWSRVMQLDAVVAGDADSKERKWSFKTGQGPEVTLGNALYGKPGDTGLPQLTYPLDLHGTYAIFACNSPAAGAVGLRLTGDERTDAPQSRHPFDETLWRWCRMDRQHLVLKQLHAYNGFIPAHIDYVKLVPLSQEQVKALEAPYAGKPDKIVAAYFEPYSWAFNAEVLETRQHREPLTAYAEAGVRIVDMQIGRFGDKVVYESRKTDQLLQGTIGDPINGVVPYTGNVGRMQQFTNTLDAELRYARELGLQPHANFGATNCYPGTPLEGDISKQHPEWVRGSSLKYEIPQVREYILSLYREALEIGAPAISIDFCRYPEGIDKPETCTESLRSLRKLADEFSKAPGKRVPILIRFPVKGVRQWQNFDFSTWVREGLVDYLCPSEIQGRRVYFDISPYVQAVRGTKCKLLPVMDGIGWGLQKMPGPYLWLARQFYDAGADGVYIYQAEELILGRPQDRRCVRILSSSSLVRRWLEDYERALPRYSKGIYVTGPLELGVYHPWERLRVWLEGVKMGELEMILDGKLINHCDAPPYLLGTEDDASDKIIPPGEHSLLIRARDGDGWLEQRFTIRGAK